MPTITIPKIKMRDDLVAIPRRTYEEFLDWERRIKSVKTYKATPREKRILAQARKNLAQGRFMTIEELRHGLGIEN